MADRVAALIEQLKESSWTRRVAAAEALAASGSAAQPALPALVTALGDDVDTVRLQSVAALARIGPLDRDTARAVAKRFTDRKEQDAIREAACHTLAVTGVESLALLAKALKSKSLFIRKKTVAALRRTGPEAVPLLLSALPDSHPDVRFFAAESLQRLGKAALPALEKALTAGEPLVRVGAAAALIQMDSNLVGTAVKAVIPDLQAQDRAVRLEAVTAVWQAAPNCQEALPTLIGVLRDQDDEIRFLAAEALAKIGPAAKEAVPALLAIVLHDRSEVREQPLRKVATQALGAIGPDASEAVPALIGLLKDDYATMPSGIPVNVFAALALGQIGPKARTALPALERVLGSTHPQLQHVVVTALQSIRGY